MIKLGTTGNATQFNCLAYNFYSTTPPSSCAATPAASGNNGNVQILYQADAVHSDFTHSAYMNYDAVNRLSSMTSPDHWAQTLSYTSDGSNGQFGNMSCVGTGCPVGMTFSASTNRIATLNGVTVQSNWYDAAGNMLKDGTAAGSHTYTWDAENRMASVTVQGFSTTTFVYNALGQRVKKSASTSTPVYYYYDTFGNPAGERNSSTTLEVFLPTVGGKNYVKYQGGTTYYLHTDMLATTEMVTDQTGTSVPQDMLYYPWGAVWAQYNMVDERFAGLRERDAESQLDPTPNRLYYNYLGRWLTADPAGTKAVTLTDPQTWNMYAYVRNNPTTLTDPSGLLLLLLGTATGSNAETPESESNPLEVKQEWNGWQKRSVQTWETVTNGVNHTTLFYQEKETTTITYDVNGKEIDRVSLPKTITTAIYSTEGDHPSFIKGTHDGMISDKDHVEAALGGASHVYDTIADRIRTSGNVEAASRVLAGIPAGPEIGLADNLMQAAVGVVKVMVIEKLMVLFK